MENYKSIYYRAKSIMHKEEDVQALMKEVYALADHANVAEDKAESWMIKQTYILGCGKYRKKKAREAELIELSEDAYEAQKNVDREKTIELICETLAELPDMYQATLFAIYYDQYSVKEVASIMGYSTGVIMNRLNYTHKYLSRKLENYQAEHDVDVQFSVEMVYEALKEWAEETSIPEGSSLEAVKEELQAYCAKRGVDKKILALIAMLVGGLLVLAFVAFLLLGNGDKKEEQSQKPTIEDEELSLDDDVLDEEVPEDEEAEEEEEQTQDYASSEYILPDSSTRKLTRAELQGLTKEQLRLARNEIFARHGVIFGVADLDAYFGEKSWYQPSITLEEFNENSNMNANEYANLSLIVEMEDEAE